VEKPEGDDKDEEGEEEQGRSANSSDSEAAKGRGLLVPTGERESSEHEEDDEEEEEEEEDEKLSSSSSSSSSSSWRASEGERTPEERRCRRWTQMERRWCRTRLRRSTFMEQEGQRTRVSFPQVRQCLWKAPLVEKLERRSPSLNLLLHSTFPHTRNPPWPNRNGRPPESTISLCFLVSEA